MDLQSLYHDLSEAARAQGIDNKLVFGEGKLAPRIMLIGEAPGEQEERQGKPFVGKAGQNLNTFLSVLGMHREDIFISNLIKLRPTKISAAGNVVNRPPTLEEKAFFAPYLRKEIAIVSPLLIVTLGNTALSAFCNRSVGSVHGMPLKVGEYKLFPLYHPAAIIYNPALNAEYAKDLHGLKQLLERL